MTCKKKYVILSGSEISHDQREKYIYCQLLGGILHFYYKAHNANAFKTIVLHFCRMTYKKQGGRSRFGSARLLKF